MSNAKNDKVQVTVSGNVARILVQLRKLHQIRNELTKTADDALGSGDFWGNFNDAIQCMEGAVGCAIDDSNFHGLAGEDPEDAPTEAGEDDNQPAALEARPDTRRRVSVALPANVFAVLREDYRETDIVSVMKWWAHLPERWRTQVYAAGASGHLKDLHLCSLPQSFDDEFWKFGVGRAIGDDEVEDEAAARARLFEWVDHVRSQEKPAVEADLEKAIDPAKLAIAAEDEPKPPASELMEFDVQGVRIRVRLVDDGEEGLDDEKGLSCSGLAVMPEREVVISNGCPEEQRFEVLASGLAILDQILQEPSGDSHIHRQGCDPLSDAEKIGNLALFQRHQHNDFQRQGGHAALESLGVTAMPPYLQRHMEAVEAIRRAKGLPVSDEQETKNEEPPRKPINARTDPDLRNEAGESLDMIADPNKMEVVVNRNLPGDRQLELVRDGIAHIENEQKHDGAARAERPADEPKEVVTDEDDTEDDQAADRPVTVMFTARGEKITRALSQLRAVETLIEDIDHRPFQDHRSMMRNISEALLELEMAVRYELPVEAEQYRFEPPAEPKQAA